LQAAGPPALRGILEALAKASARPRPDDPAPYRAVLLAARRLAGADRGQAVVVLRHWTGDRRPGNGGADAGLTEWERWFAARFPKEPPLPPAGGAAAGARQTFEELLAFLDRDPAGRNGDVTRGRAVFVKAQCARCHRHGRDGEGVGPDLTALGKRFNRRDILEAVVYPSRVVSDQYRSVAIETRQGREVVGLPSARGDAIVVQRVDGSVETVAKADVERQTPSPLSAMPEGLLDGLTRQEVADLFAYLESP
jgi:putative heme-binding domain-containing protein